MDGHRSRVFAVTFHPERETEFISAGWDNTIQVRGILQVSTPGVRRFTDPLLLCVPRSSGTAGKSRPLGKT